MNVQSAELSEKPFEQGIVVFLVDDQAIIGEAVRRMLASREDIAFHFCQDPKQALSKAEELRPTVILQDLVMPEVNGLDLVREYRRQDATKLTPLIVLSTKEEADTKAEAFARGANDYIVKLPDPVELIARIQYHSRGYIALQERNQAFSALKVSEQALRDELSKAAAYVRSLLPEPVADPIKADWRFIPSESLGGDAFDYQWLDEDHLAICLLDVCGHGVGPALLSVSVLNVLRSQTLPATDFRNPGEVLKGLNNAFQMADQHGMFFTMWYGVYNVRERELTYSGGGHPPALLISPDGKGADGLRRLESQAPMIGFSLDVEFPFDKCRVEPGEQLYVYSDGVFEIPMTNGQMMQMEDFITFMAEPAKQAGSKMDDLRAHARELQGHERFADDFSIVELTL